MSVASSVCVFRPHDWANPAPSVWEAEATPRTTGGRPPFEATVLTDQTQAGAWWWFLYQPETDEPTAPLIQLATGRGRTLADAQRQTEHAARTWRDDPPAPDPLTGLTPCTLVACSKCGTGYSVTELAANDGRCIDPDELPFCDSQIFDGYHALALIEAAKR